MSSYKYFTTSINEGDVYLGKGAGKKIIKAIHESKESIKIVSPYLSEDYIALLCSKANQGVDVKLITYYPDKDYHRYSGIIHKLIRQERYVDDKQLSKKQILIEQQKKIGRLKKIIWALFLCVIYLSFFKKKLHFIIPIIVAVVLWWASEYNNKLNKQITYYPIYYYKYFDNIDYRIVFPKAEPLHSKLYIIDNTVFMGSANFTNSGVNYNLEMMFSSQEKKIVNDIEQYFELLLNHNNLVNRNFLINNYFSERYHE